MWSTDEFSLYHSLGITLIFVQSDIKYTAVVSLFFFQLLIENNFIINPSLWLCMENSSNLNILYFARFDVRVYRGIVSIGIIFYWNFVE